MAFFFLVLAAANFSCSAFFLVSGYGSWWINAALGASWVVVALLYRRRDRKIRK